MNIIKTMWFSSYITPLQPCAHRPFSSLALIYWSRISSGGGGGGGVGTIDMLDLPCSYNYE